MHKGSSKIETVIIGQTLTIERTVTKELLASSLKSGSLDVFATPAMIAFMEETSLVLAERFLEDGKSTVGTAVNISHLAPTPPGMKVTATATITAFDGRKFCFDVTCADEREIVGKGTHERFIIDCEKFIKKVNDKAQG